MLKILKTTGLLFLLSGFLLASCFTPFASDSAMASSDVMDNQTQIEAPQRIIVLPLFAEEILLEMIDPDRIIGVWHDYMKGGEVYTPTMELTKDKECWIEIEDTDRIIDFQPDLVISWKVNYDLNDTIITLEQAGIDVLFVVTPVTFDDVREAILMLGDVVEAQEKAADMLRDFDAQCEQLAQAISSIPEEERVRVADYHNYGPLRVYNETLSDAAGVISDDGTIFTHKRSPDYLEIDDQLLAEWNPDLITFCPYYTDTDGSLLGFGQEYVDGKINRFLEDLELADTSAIQKNNIHPLCIYQSQYMVQSAADLARLAYPHLFDEQSK